MIQSIDPSDKLMDTFGNSLLSRFGGTRLDELFDSWSNPCCTCTDIECEAGLLPAGGKDFQPVKTLTKPKKSRINNCGHLQDLEYLYSNTDTSGIGKQVNCFHTHLCSCCRHRVLYRRATKGRPVVSDGVGGGCLGLG